MKWFRSEHPVCSTRDKYLLSQVYFGRLSWEEIRHKNGMEKLVDFSNKTLQAGSEAGFMQQLCMRCLRLRL